MESPVRLLVFDLDGTLVDSKEDLSVAVNVAIGSLGIPPLPHESIYGFIGDGAATLVRRSLPPDRPDLLPDALERFLSYYGRHLLDTTRAYPGVADSLRKWSGTYKMAVLTNKPLAMTEAVLAGLSLSHHFAAVRGADSYPTKKPDRWAQERHRGAWVRPPGETRGGVREERRPGGKAAGRHLLRHVRPGAESFAAHPPDFQSNRFPTFRGTGRPD
jgi:hypothetical protein